MNNEGLRVGVIGQGYIGGNLSKWLEIKGVDVVRHSLSDDHSKEIGECDLVFVAVPAGTEFGSSFNDRVIMDVLGLVKAGSVVVIKSTVPEWVLKKIDEKFDVTVMMSPEFLTEATAWEDTVNPERLIIGVKDENDEELVEKARVVMEYMPRAKFEVICKWGEASAVKYIGNSFFNVKNVYFNMCGDWARENGWNWDVIRSAVAADSRIGSVHTENFHKTGRGAGGDCLIKDFAMFRRMLEGVLPNDDFGMEAIRLIEKKNLKYLIDSGKDFKLLKSVYGSKVYLRNISSKYEEEASGE
jgi:UDP-glucose 6-dehydrogenase